jgi:ligand-binding sensor domain-containing protein
MKKYILIILCCLTSFPLWSYNVNMIVEHYSVDQGLPNNTVNCTLKDRDGFIWFGTWYGLCCFDGVKFKTFNKQEPYQVPNQIKPSLSFKVQFTVLLGSP